MMTDPNDDQSDTSEFSDAAKRSQDAGIADETAAYDRAIDKDAPASLDEGDPATKDDGSGTSETD